MMQTLDIHQEEKQEAEEEMEPVEAESEEDELIEVAIDYAMRFAGAPYIWGGNNPLEGFDCSGFVQEILASMGLDPRGDQTAQGLFNYFQEKGCILDAPTAGALLFFGKDENRITHIAFCINDWQMIEAGGGGRRCRTFKDAAEHNAFVRIRRCDNRDDVIACLYPFP